MRDWGALVRDRLVLADRQARCRGRVVRELTQQLQDAYDDGRARGLTDDQAEAFALAQIGDWGAFADAVHEATRTDAASRLDEAVDALDARGSRGRRRSHLLAGLGADLLIGLRTIRTRPSFSAAVVLTLAVGIGITTALFGLLEAAFLRSLPVPAPTQLVELGVVGRRGPTAAVLAYPTFRALNEAGDPAVRWFASGHIQRLVLDVDGVQQRGSVEPVSGDYFDRLGLRPTAGRFFLPGEDEPEAGSVVCVISQELRRARFGDDRAVVGRTLVVARVPFTIVGVAPAGFVGIRRGSSTDVWVPLGQQHLFRLDAMEREWDYFGADLTWLAVYGRLSPGLSLAAAQSRVRALSAGIDGMTSRGTPPRWFLRTAERGQMGLVSPLRAPLAVGFGAAGLILLVACVNVAGLLLVGGHRRRREMAIRLALGAPRGRLIRQTLVETLALAVAGGLVGLLLARWSAWMLARWAASVVGVSALGTGTEASIGLSLDAPWIGFTLALSVLAALVSGLAPAIRTSRLEAAPTLAGGTGRVSEGSGRALTARALVATQVAASVVLVTVAGLLLRSFLNQGDVALGFQTRGLATTVLQGPAGLLDGPRGEALLDAVLARVRAIPGVRSAALANHVPISVRYGSAGQIRRFDGAEERRESLSSYTNPVWPGFFATMGIRIVAGRDFTDHEHRGGIEPVIINRALADEAWPGQNPIGRRLTLPPNGSGDHERRPLVEVVGVVENGMYRGPEDGISADLFLNRVYGRLPREIPLVVATSGDVLAVMPAVARAVSAVDPGLVCVDVETLEARASRALGRPRSTAALFGLFAAVAVLLAAGGLHGVLAFSVASRTREIGIRMAIGASRRSVMAAVLRSAGLIVLGGLVPGIAGAVAAGRAISSMLFGVHPVDVVTMAGMAATLLVAGLAAAWLPARRASRVDPIVALRGE